MNICHECGKPATVFQAAHWWCEDHKQGYYRRNESPAMETESDCSSMNIDEAKELLNKYAGAFGKCCTKSWQGHLEARNISKNLSKIADLLDRCVEKPTVDTQPIGNEDFM